MFTAFRAKLGSRKRPISALKNQVDLFFSNGNVGPFMVLNSDALEIGINMGSTCDVLEMVSTGINIIKLMLWKRIFRCSTMKV